MFREPIQSSSFTWRPTDKNDIQTTQKLAPNELCCERAPEASLMDKLRPSGQEDLPSFVHHY